MASTNATDSGNSSTENLIATPKLQQKSMSISAQKKGEPTQRNTSVSKKPFSSGIAQPRRQGVSGKDEVIGTASGQEE
jgi:hypothetical protein